MSMMSVRTFSNTRERSTTDREKLLESYPLSSPGGKNNDEEGVFYLGRYQGSTPIVVFVLHSVGGRTQLSARVVSYFEGSRAAVRSQQEKVEEFAGSINTWWTIKCRRRISMEPIRSG